MVMRFFIFSHQLISQGKSPSCLWFWNLMVVPPPPPDPPPPLHPPPHLELWPSVPLLSTGVTSCRSVGFFWENFILPYVVRISTAVCSSCLSVDLDQQILVRFGLYSLLFIISRDTRTYMYERSIGFVKLCCLIREPVRYSSLEDISILLLEKSGPFIKTRYITAVCRISLDLSLTLVLISFEIEEKVFFIVFGPSYCFDYSFMEVDYIQSFTLVISDCIVGKKVLEFDLLFARTVNLIIAKNFLLHYVSNSSRLLSLVLVTKTFVFKAALIAASTMEIPHFIVFSISPSLVKLLMCGGDGNEWKSILRDICCPLGSFSPILSFMFFHTAFVLAELSMFSLLKLNISSMAGV